MTKELDELKAQNAKLTERIAKLEEAAKPPEPFVPMPRFQFDPTAGASMPASAMRAMIDAVPNMSDLRADARKPNPVTGYANPQPTNQVRRTSGWKDPAPLETPYINHIDRVVDAQDAKDRAELVQRLVQAGLGVEKKE